MIRRWGSGSGVEMTMTAGNVCVMGMNYLVYQLLWSMFILLFGES